MALPSEEDFSALEGLPSPPAPLSAAFAVLEDPSSAVREAAMVALRHITGHDFRFDPTEPSEAKRVKAVKAFDGWVVVVRINGSSAEGRLRLLGAAPCETEEELPDAAVKAVLNASNRVMEQRVAREEEEVARGTEAG